MATIQEQITELEGKIASATSPTVLKIYQSELQKLKLQLQVTTSGSEVSSAILLMKQVLEATLRNGGGGGGGLDKTQVEDIIKAYMLTKSITKDDLDDELKNYLMSTVKVQVVLDTPTFTGEGGEVKKNEYERPLFQKILCDLVAMNNVYLFGGAGTGKTFIAEKIADFLDWDFVLLSCSQMTSALDILGGQTIEGYQLGKLEMAWGNLDGKGFASTKKGAVLCLDELPKIDPNTAGTLNAALAKVKDYKAGVPPFILNGRNEKIVKKNLLIIGTGNVKLNEMSTEYEANFKQDLSLQDRFVGATYEVGVDYEFEARDIMEEVLFIWIPLIKIREKIVEMRWTGQAFVSLRIMITLRDTYLTYRKILAQRTQKTATGVVEKINQPKTLENGLNSFLNLFKPDQMDILKLAMDYDNFIGTIIPSKDVLEVTNLNTKDEEKETKVIIATQKKIMKDKIA